MASAPRPPLVEDQISILKLKFCLTSLAQELDRMTKQLQAVFRATGLPRQERPNTRRIANVTNAELDLLVSLLRESLATHISSSKSLCAIFDLTTAGLALKGEQLLWDAYVLGREQAKQAKDSVKSSTAAPPATSSECLNLTHFTSLINALQTYYEMLHIDSHARLQKVAELRKLTETTPPKSKNMLQLTMPKRALIQCKGRVLLLGRLKRSKPPLLQIHKANNGSN